MPSRSRQLQLSRWRSAPWWLAAGGAIVALVAAVAAAAPADNVRGWLETLSADGHIDDRTWHQIEGRRPWLWLIAAMAAGAAATCVRRRAALRATLAARAAELRTAWHDVGWRWTAARGALLAIIALAALLTVPRLSLGLRVDEAHTLLHSVRASYVRIATDYADPNNHILHSMAARTATLVLGESDPVLRLPAFLFGLATIALLAAAVRRHGGTSAALCVAALVATSYYHVDLCTNARGYTMINAAFAGLLLLVRSTADRAPPVAAWAFATVAALGLFAVPMMAYPLACVVLLAGLRATPRGGAAATTALRRAATAALAGAALAALAYMPAFFVTPSTDDTGVQLAWLAGRETHSLAAAAGLLAELGEQYLYCLPAALRFPALLCFFAGLVRGWPLASAALGGYALVYAATGLAPPMWALPYLFLTAATITGTGIAQVARWTAGGRPLGIILAVAVCGVLAAGQATRAVALRPHVDNPWHLGYLDIDAATAWLAEHLPREDAVLVEAGPLIHARLLRLGMRNPARFLDQARLATAPVAYSIVVSDGNDSTPARRRLRAHGGIEARRLAREAELRALGFAPPEPAAVLPRSRILRWVRSRDR